MAKRGFDETFEALTGNRPFPWQRTLYEDWLAKGMMPSSCNIPTGLGKTSVIALWLIALANHPEMLPRRLVYVVNRRTVVDQTTTEVEKLRANLQASDLIEALKPLCAIPLEKDEPPLAISTLRGQFADNREWSADPSRPAVIVGTVDMIGSRLLFSGYGIGFRSKPLHAGFLGQQVLLIHDEAHLEPAFQELLVAIGKEQDRCKEFGRFWVTELSATTRSAEAPFELTPGDKTDPVVMRRIEAKKTIHLHENEDEKNLAEEIADLALHHKNSGRAILVFARKVEDVERIVSKLKTESEVQQLTGTLRGLERDQLVNDPIFVRFLPSTNRSQNIVAATGTVFLVCTSAGEVGVNISADHLVCDLTTFESMAQRFGRVNRFGDSTDTEIHVVHPKKFDQEDAYERRREKTLALLKHLHVDGSPAALPQLDPQARRDAFAPTPTMLPVTDILLDSWALTTIYEKLPGRPPVEPYLHGIAEWQPPETYVAWRQEVGVIKDDLLEIQAPEDLLEDYPLKPHELLRDRSDRVFKHLTALAQRDNRKHVTDPAWLVGDDGTVEVVTLGELADKNNKDRINHRTILLPPEVGGLDNGLLNGNSGSASDVADEWFEDADRTVRRRLRVRNVDPRPARFAGMRLIRTIDAKPDEMADESETPRRYWYWYELSKAGETEGSKTAALPVAWQTHTDDVVGHAGRIAAKLELADELRQAMILAAKFHDLGKKRLLWQRGIGNPNPQNWLAKSGGRMRPRNITPYRHEFGSLLDVDGEQEFQQLPDGLQDVVLHLIASHHGRGRPHFSADESFDSEPKGKDMAAVATEVARRFARLQRQYGRWGLAYLESLLRAADYAASANPSKSEGD